MTTQPVPLPLGYYIPASTFRCEIEIMKSRFIATAGRVTCAQDTKAFLTCVRKELPRANHYVYAFRIGYGKSVIEGMSDDGEPAGTAGPPVLAVVRGSIVGDLMIVVARCFGGTKLGTGGLVRAYTLSAQEVIAGLSIMSKIDKKLLSMEVSYSFYEHAKRIIAAHFGEIEDESFAENITLIVSLIEPQVEIFVNTIRDATSGRIQIISL